MDKFYNVTVTTEKGVKQLFCNHYYDVEVLIEALLPGEFLSVHPLLIVDVTKDNVESIIHG